MRRILAAALLVASLASAVAAAQVVAPIVPGGFVGRFAPASPSLGGMLSSALSSDLRVPLLSLVPALGSVPSEVFVSEAGLAALGPLARFAPPDLPKRFEAARAAGDEGAQQALLAELASAFEAASGLLAERSRQALAALPASTSPEGLAEAASSWQGLSFYGEEPARLAALLQVRARKAREESVLKRLRQTAEALEAGTAAGLDQAPAAATAQPADNGGLGRRIALAPATHAKAAKTFPSFKQYVDLALHDPKWGYYASGKARIGQGGDFTTVPEDLSPHFGGMVAGQALKMYAGMRAAKTLGKDEPFTVVEFGGGTGRLALDFLRSVQRLGGAFASDLAKALRYVIVERSPELRKRQLALVRGAAKPKPAPRDSGRGGPARETSAGREEPGLGDEPLPDELAAKFDSVPGDARSPLHTFPPGSLKGLVVSNELPDAFAPHKVLVTLSEALAGFVIPVVLPGLVDELASSGARELAEAVLEADKGLRADFGLGGEGVYLDLAGFQAVMGWLAGLSAEAALERLGQGALSFHETFLPAGLVPELAAHLARNLAGLLKAGPLEPLLLYANPDADAFIQGAGAALGAGYVMTIDYGGSQPSFAALGRLGRLRTYPANPGHDPFLYPGMRDITTDQDFTAMAKAGFAAGLKTVHFGPQGAVAAGTMAGRALEALALRLPKTSAASRARFMERDGGRWVSGTRNQHEALLPWKAQEFLDPFTAFKVLVQQKEGTDPAYEFPAGSGEPLE